MARGVVIEVGVVGVGVASFRHVDLHMSLFCDQDRHAINSHEHIDLCRCDPLKCKCNVLPSVNGDSERLVTLEGAVP